MTKIIFVWGKATEMRLKLPLIVNKINLNEKKNQLFNLFK